MLFKILVNFFQNTFLSSSTFFQENFDRRESVCLNVDFSHRFLPKARDKSFLLGQDDFPIIPHQHIINPSDDKSLPDLQFTMENWSTTTNAFDQTPLHSPYSLYFKSELMGPKHVEARQNTLNAFILLR